MPSILILTLSLAAASMCLAATATRAVAQDAPPPPALPVGTTLFDSDATPLALTGQAATTATMEAVDVAGQPFRRAYRVAIAQRPNAPYDVQLTAKLPAPLSVGRTMMLSGYARSVRTEEETNEVRVGFVLEQAGAAHDKEVHGDVRAPGEWKAFHFPFRARHDHAETGTQVALRLGFGAQAAEVGGVTLTEYADDVSIDALPRTVVRYDGWAADAPWRRRAAERIERHRKGDLTVQVVDAAGRPVSGARVAMRMTRHAFGFGSVYNPGRVAGKNSTGPDADIYRQKFADLFNEAVDEWAMKWPGWEQPEARSSAVQSAAWVRSKGIPLRGHTMIWPSWRRSPGDIAKLTGDPAAMRTRAADHIAAVGTAFAGQVIDWDVVNEPYTHFDMLDVLGRDVMVDWFKLARQADPSAVLYLNEAGQPNSPPNHERYRVMHEHIRMLIDAGAPIGGIGLQGHFGQNLNAPDQLLEIYDRYAEFGLPIKITELDIDHPDERIQADYMRDFLTVSFSHERIEGILLWGFWEGQHWKPSAALWRKDWSIKPVGQAWMDLVRTAWWTNADGATDASGAFATRGFCGTYDITIDDATGHRRRTVTAVLGRTGNTLRVTLD